MDTPTGFRLWSENWRSFASYGRSLVELSRRIAEHVDKIPQSIRLRADYAIE